MFQMRGASMMQYVALYNGPVRTAAMKFMLTVGTMIRRTRARRAGQPDLAQAHGAYLTGMWRGAPNMT